MNNLAFDSRNRRNLFAHVMNAFSPPFHKNYCTDTTAEMKTPYGDSLFINTMHLIPEPMKMKLADSVVSLDEEKPKTNMAADTRGFLNNAKEANNTRSDYYPSLAGIGSFFSGVFNVMGAMFQKRANSPVQYYDCFEQGFEEQHQMTPSALAWQGAKHEDLNKNGRAETDDFADDTFAEMSGDFRSIAAQCEDKLNRVRLLLSGNTVQRAARQRRPKRAFHEASSVEELFEDAFTPEDFINLANETFFEYCSPFNNHHEEKHEADAPKIKTETIKESMEIIQNVAPKDCDQSKLHTDDKCEESDKKKEVVTSCEDKVNQLKALLQRRRQKPNKLDLCTESTNSDKTPAIPIPNCTDTQKTTDVIFAKDIELPSSPESPHVLEPNSYFDEVTGRFYSSSATDSEDSFQIVFSDSPRTRKHIPSDCESEDSFIVFEESPDSCYTSNDVFGDEIDAINSDSDCESDCGSEFDSGVGTITLSHSLSRTFGDLTDGSLYEDRSEDVVDCAFRSGSELPMEAIDEEKVDEGPGEVEDQGGYKGLLLTEAKKRERKKLPPKKVQFSSQPPRVHVMRVWAFAARQARAGHWERHALDRERFKRRIADVEVAVSWVLKPQHRSRVMFQRFMPWWNAQRRKELAEKKQREEDRVNREKEELERLEAEQRLTGNEEVHAEDCANTTDDTNGDERKTEELVDNNNSVETQEVSSRIVDVNCKVDDTSIKTDRVVLNSNVDSKLEEKSIVCKTQDKVRDRIDNETLCNGNSDVNCNDIDRIDDQIVSKDKLIGQSKANTDCDKTICNELSKVTVNGDVIVNNNGLRNGMKVPDCKMICYKQQQVL